METLVERNLAGYKLLTVRTVVVYNLLAVDEEARSVVGSDVEVIDALCRNLDVRTEVVAE